MHHTKSESNRNPDCQANINMVTVKVESGGNPGANCRAVPRVGVAVINKFNQGNRNTSLLSNNDIGQLITWPGIKQKGSNASSVGGIPSQTTAPCTCMYESKCCGTCAVFSTGSSFDQDSTGPLYDYSYCSSADNVAEIPVRSSSRDNISGSNPSLLHGHKIHLAPEFKDQVSHVASLPDTTLNARSTPSVESISQSLLEPTCPRIEMSPHSRMPGCHQSQSGHIHVQMEPGYSCTSLPMIEGVYEASTQQVSMIQQQATQHSLMSPRRGLALAAPENASSGGPIASSTPTGKMGFRVVHQCIPDYRSMAVNPSSWHGPNKEQWQWMSNMAPMPSVQNSAVMYNQSKTFYDGGWNPDTIGRPYIYFVNQDIPLDMSPTSRRAVREQKVVYPRPSSTSKSLKNSRREPVKRSLNKTSLESGTDRVTPIAKAAKAAKSSEKKPANCRSSTNVHTLEPRHFVSWYIDHLIQENEDITNISKSNTWQEVSIFQSKDLYFMEPLIKRSEFPSSKFLSWMQENFPNINIRAIDFTEGRQGKFRTNFEDELNCKTKSEIINDTFLYFQRIQSGKT